MAVASSPRRTSPTSTRKNSSSASPELLIRCGHPPCSSGASSTPSRPSSVRGRMPLSSSVAPGVSWSAISTTHSSATNPIDATAAVGQVEVRVVVGVLTSPG